MKKSALFLLAAVVLAVLGTFFRHQNQTEAKNQAAAIVALDQTSQPVTQPTQTLSDFVKSHTGASVTYTLTGSYDRAQTAAKSAVVAQAATSQVYADAQKACSGKTDSITQAHCNEAYIQQHLTSIASPAPVTQPKESDYTYTLRSPIWTADLAGAFYLGALISLLMAIIPGRRRHI